MIQTLFPKNDLRHCYVFLDQLIEINLPASYIDIGYPTSLASPAIATNPNERVQDAY